MDAILPADRGGAAWKRLGAREEMLAALALFFVGIIWIPAAVVALLLLTAVPGYWLVAEVSTATLLVLLWWWLFGRKPRKEALCLLAVVLGLVGASAALSMYFYDVSSDGRWYHADAILGLLHGVNPIYALIPATQPVWANHYPKGVWYFSALVIHTFHTYQLGKIYNFLLILAAGFFAADFFHKCALKGRYSSLFALGTALTPVAAAQMVTYYVDGALASLLALIVMATANLVFRPSRLDRIIFVLAASLAIAIKFTAIPYVATIVCTALATQMLPRKVRFAIGCKRDLKAMIVCAGAACTLGVFLLGFNPYITNMRQRQNPMYPVLGPNKIDIISATAPPTFLGPRYNAVEKFAISFFGKSRAFSRCKAAIEGQNTALADCHEPMKLPFTVDKEELISQCVPELHIAGWGVFFSGVTLGALALFVFGRYWRGNAPIVFALSLVFVTTAINPVSWWARYVPQLALVPVFLLAATFRGRQRRSSLVARFLCGFLLLDSLLAAGGAIGASFIKSRKLERGFAAVVRAGGPGEYWAYRNPPNPEQSWAFTNPDSLVHYEQFSGHQGIVICAELNPPGAVLPNGGFPLGLNMRGATEVTLYKGGCSLGPPLSSGQ